MSVFGSAVAYGKTNIRCVKSHYEVVIDAENVSDGSGQNRSQFVVKKDGVQVLNGNFQTYDASYNSEMSAFVWGFRNDDDEQIGIGTRLLPGNKPAPGTWNAKAQGRIVTPDGTFLAGPFDMANCTVVITN